MTLFAKSADAEGARETLEAHSLSVVKTARLLFNRLPPHQDFDARLLADLEISAAAHDTGKAATGFQAMVLGEQRNWQGRRHEVLSAAFAAILGAREEAIFAVLTHHKRIPDYPPTDDSGRLIFRSGRPEDWEELVKQFEENRPGLEEMWTRVAETLGRPDLVERMSQPVSSDFLKPAWVRTDRQRKRVSKDLRRRASLIRGLLISADHLTSGGVSVPPAADLKQFRPKFPLRPFQKRAAISGNLILRAPTGSGKTEAALTWAAHNQPRNGRLFYTLPYTAALNAMYGRIRSEFPAAIGSIGLLHGRAAHHLLDAMEKDFPGSPAAATAEALARARLAREMYHTARVCTPHQLLRFTLRGKGWEQILTEIPGGCIVFDEVHSYDPSLAGLTLGTAKLFHNLGAKLMFISATLPSFLERTISELVPCSIVTPDHNLDGDRDVVAKRRHLITVEDCTLLDLLPSIIARVRSGAHVLIVCNHVRSAQSVASVLRAQFEPNTVCLFHGRFNMRDRKAIEARLIPGLLPRILVATQVVEVSLDISFDCGYFEAAPIDALAQRMGRVNRRGEAPPATISIAARSISKHALYDSCLTDRTLNLLRNLTSPISEQEVVDICNNVYSEGYQGEDLAKFLGMLNHRYLTHFEESLVAGDHENWTERVIEVENRLDVLPMKLRLEHGKLIHERRWLEADALTVNIRRSAALDPYLDRSQDPWLTTLDYTEDGLASPD